MALTEEQLTACYNVPCSRAMAAIKSASLGLALLLVLASCVAGNGRKTMIDPHSVLVMAAPPSKECEHMRSIRPGRTDNIKTMRHKAARAGANVLVLYSSTRIDLESGYETWTMGHAFLCPNLKAPQA